MTAPDQCCSNVRKFLPRRRQRPACGCALTYHKQFDTTPPRKDNLIEGEGFRTNGFDPRFDRLIARLPSWLSSSVQWLRQPSSAWIRLPAAVFLICGGLLGFLPLLGFWMLPLGLLLLADDVPALRSARTRVMNWIERRRPTWLAAVMPSPSPSDP